MSDTLTGPSTRYLAFQSCAGGPWQSQKTIPANREALFHTREAAQAYCDWRNGGIDARKSEPEEVEDEASSKFGVVILDDKETRDRIAASDTMYWALKYVLMHGNLPEHAFKKVVAAIDDAEGK